MEEMTDFAIVVEKTQAMLVTLKSDDTDEQRVELFRGTTLQVKRIQQIYTTVMICGMSGDSLVFENNLYYVKTSTLKFLQESIWLQMLAIPDPLERANIVKDQAYLDYLETLKLNSFVKINAHHFSMCPVRQSLQFLPEREKQYNGGKDYDCIIRYIGFVNEIGPGHYYGLELLVNFIPTNI
jgi:hypothetical protein